MRRCVGFSGFEYRVSHNRRVQFKNNRHINTWNLAQAPAVQSLGSVEPTDPEVGGLAFSGSDGELIGLVFNFALHANAHHGYKFSADYPGVVAREIAAAYGREIPVLFMAGACGDLNPTKTYQGIGKRLAEAIVGQLKTDLPAQESLDIHVMRREITVPTRPFWGGLDDRLAECGWPESCYEFFAKTHVQMQKRGVTPFDFGRDGLVDWGYGVRVDSRGVVYEVGHRAQNGQPVPLDVSRYAGWGQSGLFDPRK